MVPIDLGNLRDFVVACAIVTSLWGLWDLIRVFT
jgi:hypothetical protein